MEGFSGHGLACIRSERVVFEGLDFALSPGDALILRGPNGSGKSSLLRLMAGLASPAAGELRWQGRPVTDDPEAFFAALQFLGHRDAVKPALTIRENLAFQTRLRNIGPVQDTVLDDALDRVGLRPLADMSARLLSAGQTRRLALARILAAPATLWLLDEPTVALDPPSVSTIMAAIADHRTRGGMVVASTNVPLDIAVADDLDVSAHAASTALWGEPA